MCLRDLEPVMIALLDLAETIRQTRRRRLRPAEAEPFHWVIDALERESAEAELSALPPDQQVYWRNLIFEVCQVLAPVGRLVSAAAHEAPEEDLIGGEDAYAKLSDEAQRRKRIGNLAAIGLTLEKLLKDDLTIILARDRVGLKDDEAFSFEFSGSAGGDAEQRHGSAACLLDLLQKLAGTQKLHQCPMCRKWLSRQFFSYGRSGNREPRCKICRRKKAMEQQRTRTATTSLYERICHAAMVTVSARSV